MLITKIDTNLTPVTTLGIGIPDVQRVDMNVSQHNIISQLDRLQLSKDKIVELVYSMPRLSFMIAQSYFCKEGTFVYWIEDEQLTLMDTICSNYLKGYHFGNIK